MAAFPVCVVGRLRINLFRGLLDVHCTLRPAYSLNHQSDPFASEGLPQPLSHQPLVPRFALLRRNLRKSLAPLKPGTIGFL
jgi:hypothetical protein